MNFRSFRDLDLDIKEGIGKIRRRNHDLVVGIPRSGIIPAHMIALLLNLNCMDLPSFCRNADIAHGNTRKPGRPLQRAWDARRILLVDDSVRSGRSMTAALREIPPGFRGEITTLAVYSSTPEREDVDAFLRHLPPPRIFEWNVYHHGVIGNAGLDMDGVLCVDPTREQNDDGANYRRFMETAEPLILPTRTIKTIVTNRLEKYRAQTEAWLHRHQVEFERLVMLDLPTAEERRRLRIHARHKAEVYGDSDLELFIESEPRQAREIFRLTGRPVFCVENGTLYHCSQRPGIDGRRRILTRAGAYGRALPEPVKTILRPFYRRLALMLQP